MKLTANHERERVTVEVSMGSPNSTLVFSLGINEVNELAHFVDREFYFREDLMTELKRMVDDGKYDKALLDDLPLIEAILADYCDNRSDHSAGSGSDDMWPWHESLHEAMLNHRPEIEKYRVARSTSTDTAENAQAEKFFPAGNLEN